jgi:hypothetical protein
VGREFILCTHWCKTPPAELLPTAAMINIPNSYALTLTVWCVGQEIWLIGSKQIHPHPLAIKNFIDHA